ALWNWFRRLGENADWDENDSEGDGHRHTTDHDEDVDMVEIANVARLYAHLILEGSETLGVLKVLDLMDAGNKTGMFVELLLVVIMTTSAEDAKRSVERVFERVAETPQLIGRLQLFVKRSVRTSDLVEKRDRDAVRRGCKIALETLANISRAVREEK